MDTNAHVQGKIFIGQSMESLAVGSAMNPGFGDADTVRRSENNILKWMTYLPEDCITRMIEMKWDITT